MMFRLADKYGESKVNFDQFKMIMQAIMKVREGVAPSEEGRRR
jgi:hypothetical protein